MLSICKWDGSEHSEPVLYAENDSELSGGNRGEIVNRFYKIKKLKRATLFYLNAERGYFERDDGLFGQFAVRDDGKKWYQWTCSKIKRL